MHKNNLSDFVIGATRLFLAGSLAGVSFTIAALSLFGMLTR